jgi:hypothetical protein
MSTDLHTLILPFMVWGLLPVWVLAGIADYLLHRRTAIERTSGLKECALHVLQAAQVGVPLLAGLFLEINSLVLVVIIVCVAAHTLTALWDTAYTTPRRFISPLEQHVHSHLEYIPIVAATLVVLLYWEPFIGLFGVGRTTASFSMHLKERPVPTPWLVAVLASVFLVQGSLLVEETLRTWRAKRGVPQLDLRRPDPAAEREADLT